MSKHLTITLTLFVSLSLSPHHHSFFHPLIALSLTLPLFTSCILTPVVLYELLHPAPSFRLPVPFRISRPTTQATRTRLFIMFSKTYLVAFLAAVSVSAQGRELTLQLFRLPASLAELTTDHVSSTTANFFDAASAAPVTQIGACLPPSSFLGIAWTNPSLGDGQPQAPVATSVQVPAYAPSSVKAPEYASAASSIASSSAKAPEYTVQSSSPAAHSATAIAYHASAVSPIFSSKAIPTSAAPKYTGTAAKTATGANTLITAPQPSGTGFVPFPGSNNTVTLPTAPATTVVNNEAGGVTTVTAPGASATSSRGSSSGAGRIEFGVGAIALAGLAFFL